MKVIDLIQALKNFDPDQELLAWHEHELFEIKFLTGDKTTWVNLTLGEKK